MRQPSFGRGSINLEISNPSTYSSNSSPAGSITSTVSSPNAKFSFIEIAARVGGAYISDVVEAATNINLWREWARLEVGAGKQPYQLPATRRDYAGVIVSLARQEQPDTSAYQDPEIVYRVSKYHHAGFVLKSSKPERIQQLLDSYSTRFAQDFLATQPVPEKPTA